MSAEAQHIETVARLALTPPVTATPANGRHVEAGPGLEDEPDKRRLIGYSLRELREIQFPPRPALLCHEGTAIIRAGDIVEAFAPRGTGKSLFCTSLGVAIASGRPFLRWHVPAPVRVVYVDGEMVSEDIRARALRLAGALGADDSIPFRIVARDWQESLPRLDTIEGVALLTPEVADADLVILDNRSCLFDPEAEKDPSAWNPAQDFLFGLRRQGKATVLVHHSNRQGGARGHSRPEDAMDIIIKLTRPADYRQDQGARFTVEFEKARGFYGSAAEPFIAGLTEQGWTVEGAERAVEDSVAAKLREYLKVADQVGERPTSATAAVRGAGVNRAGGLRAFADMQKRGEIKLHPAGGHCLA
jgi:putative DNA primase/helicase